MILLQATSMFAALRCVAVLGLSITPMFSKWHFGQMEAIMAEEARHRRLTNGLFLLIESRQKTGVKSNNQQGVLKILFEELAHIVSSAEYIHFLFLEQNLLMVIDICINKTFV